MASANQTHTGIQTCTLWPLKHRNYMQQIPPLDLSFCFIPSHPSHFISVFSLCFSQASNPFCLFIPPLLSLPSPSLSKWVSSGVLAGRNHLGANTLLSVVKASPQIPFYTHKCHFPFVCAWAALAEPSRALSLISNAPTRRKLTVWESSCPAFLPH